VVADIDDALIASGSPARRVRQVLALYWGVAVLAVLVGVFGLVRDSWLAMATSRSCVHALFGLLLVGLVIARFLWWLKHSPPSQKADIRRFSRQLSRLIYLVLYLVIVTKQIIGIVNFMWHGGTLDFGLMLDNDSAQDLGIYKSTADFRAILVCGLIALALIRGLAFWTWLRLVEEVAIRAQPIAGSVRLKRRAA
jgi:cytochrome b561